MINNKIGVTSELLEEHGKSLRSALNSFIHSKYTSIKKPEDRTDLEALRTAILIERLIINRGFYIEYSRKATGELSRAEVIIPMAEGLVQSTTIEKEYGHIVGIVEKEEQRTSVKGKLAYNETVNKVAVIMSQSLGNDKSTMRFSVKYVKNDNTLSTTAWNVSSCKVFDTFSDLESYISMTDLIFAGKRIIQFKKDLHFIKSSGNRSASDSEVLYGNMKS